MTHNKLMRLSLTFLLNASGSCIAMIKHAIPKDTKQLLELPGTVKENEEKRIRELSYKLEESNYSGLEVNNLQAFKLINEGANPNIFRKRAPLIAASCFGNIKLINALLKAKADPNIVDKREWSPLGAAWWGGHIDAMKLLVRAGAQITSNWYNSFGGMRTMKDAMYDNMYASRLAPLFRSLCVHPRTAGISNALLSFHHQGLVKETIWIVVSYIPDREDIGDAIEQHNLESFHEFLKSGIDVNARCLNGETPLTTALIHPSWATGEMASKLLEKGANLHIRSSDGRLPTDIIKRHYLYPNTSLHQRIIAAYQASEKARSGEIPKSVKIDDCCTIS